jgi:hypothetical protein
MGLSPKAIINIRDQIQKDGELSQMKKHVLEIKGDAFNQINSGLSKLKKQLADAPAGEDEAKPDFADVDGDGDEKEPVKKGAEEKDVKEGYTFISHLLNEVSMRDIAQAEIDATGGREGRVKRARVGDTVLRKDREQELRDMEKSTDPIDRQILGLKKRLAMLQDKKAKMSGSGVQ